MKIFKYPLKLTDEQTIKIPAGAVILCVQIQREYPCVWALVEEVNGLEEFKFWIYGTGNPISIDPKYKNEWFPPREFLRGQRYVGTFQMADGSLVWHVFTDGDVARYGGVE